MRSTVPLDWAIMPFDGFAVLQRGRDLTKSQFRSGEVPVAGSNGVIGFHDTAYVPAPGVTVGRSGSVGKVAIYHCPFWAHNTCLYVRDFCGNDEGFAYYLLQHLDVGRYKSGASVPTLDRNSFRTLPVSIPPLDEQRRIAGVLSAVQRAIERQERLIALTAELKKALMHKFFTEGTRGERGKQQTRFGEAPASWSVIPLGECCDVQTGVAKGRSVNSDAITVPYLRVANVQDGRLDLREVKTITIRRSELSRFSLRRGDVVLTEGGDLDKLGRGFIWNGEVAECVHQNHIFAVRPHPERVSSEFIAYQTQSPYGKQYFLSVAHKTTNLACINTSKLKAFPVLVPTPEEQNEIVRILQLLDRRRVVVADTLASLQALFRALLHQLMTAQIRVHDLDLSALGIEEAAASA